MFSKHNVVVSVLPFHLEAYNERKRLMLEAYKEKGKQILLDFNGSAKQNGQELSSQDDSDAAETKTDHIEIAEECIKESDLALQNKKTEEPVD